jgi:Flp pilus assembly protein TadD
MVPGREAEVLAHYREALRLNPDYAEAHNNLAVLLARAGQLEPARQHWETALKLKPDYEDPRKNLELLQQMHRP